MFGIIVFILNSAAWMFLAMGLVVSGRAVMVANQKDRNYQLKTFWILLAGAVLWTCVGSIRFFILHYPGWGYFLFAIGSVVACNYFHKTAKALLKKE
jgi:hypothetical protein